VSLLASDTAAVFVNATRIVIALWLAVHPIARSALSAAQVHRVEGNIVYFGGLMLLYAAVQRLDRRVVETGNEWVLPPSVTTPSHSCCRSPTAAGRLALSSRSTHW